MATVLALPLYGSFLNVNMCGTPWARAPEENTWARQIMKYYFLGKKLNVFLLVRNIQKTK